TFSCWLPIIVRLSCQSASATACIQSCRRSFPLFRRGVNRGASQLVVKPRVGQNFQRDYRQAKNREYYLDTSASLLFRRERLDSPSCSRGLPQSSFVPNQQQHQ